MKRIHFFIIIGMLFFVSIFLISFIQAEPNGEGTTIIEISIEEETGIGDLVGEGLENEDIWVENVLILKEEDLTIITFKEEGRIEIKGNKFENILANSEIKLNSEGNIVEANILVNEIGGTYTLESPLKTFIFEAPANSTIIKEEDKPPRIILPASGNPEISLIPENQEEVIYEGSSFQIDGNQMHKKGESLEITTSGGKIRKVSGKSEVNLYGTKNLIYGEDVNFYYEDNFDASEHESKNYINYGEDKIYMGGKGITVTLQKENDIFPEYVDNKYIGSNSERKGRLEFVLEDGTLEIMKISPDDHPLALDIKSSGEIKINNGNWVLESDGNNLYATVEAHQQFPLSSDIQLNYKTNEGKTKSYELEVGSSYSAPRSKQEKERIQLKIDEFENLKREKVLESNAFFSQNHELEELQNRLEEREEESWEVYEDLLEIRGTLANSARNGESSELMAELEREYGEIKERYDFLEREKDLLRENPLMRESRDFKYEIEDLNGKIQQLDFEKSEGIYKTGIWGQTLSSQDADAEMSYSEFIEGFPVIKNADVRAYYNYDGNSNTLGNIISVYDENLDILDLEVDSRYQTCADTQIELHALWQLQELEKGNRDSVEFKIANGQTLKYNSDGTYTLWSVNSNKAIIKTFEGDPKENFAEWITNVQIYSNTGSLRANLEKVNDIDDLKSGDLITLHPDPLTGYGHTKGIKRIFRIPPTEDGELYYELFAGSDPAIDARIYSHIISQKELLYQFKYEDAAMQTWK